MTLFKRGTNIRFSNDDHIEMTLARLARIVTKGIHPGRTVFYEHEAKEVLRELVTEIRENTEYEMKKVEYQIGEDGAYGPIKP